MTNEEIKNIETDIMDNILSNVMDPELEIDIISLGLIYDLYYDGKKTISIVMTLSTPACPLGDAITQNVEESIKNKYPDFEIDIHITFEPTWTTEMISDEGKEKLGM